ncbi:Rhodanese-like domain-containing protein [Radiomyces spectabilis]|uniref:Rhodanese-like domain-containing protein n=1 Tax=Radiomyces spectabilis TaxID=64574 RepID=UPI00221EFD70|nr:Rhodanese-like domain-containing protein [Radiomyces spectabilis]KAI8384302.1 Rhodanese-like domain-containing protein [Radiomyces spectabilis]
MSHLAPYAESEELKALILDPTKVPRKDYLVIDVRDTDFEGGNIPHAVNVPAGQLLDRVHEIIDEYGQVPCVYFHCALSQVRGPKAARIYKESLHLQGIQTNQQVKVLRGGFEGWHAKYRKEKQLLENYDPSIWQWAIEDSDPENEQSALEDNPYLAGIPPPSQ